MRSTSFVLLSATIPPSPLQLPKNKDIHCMTLHTTDVSSFCYIDWMEAKSRKYFNILYTTSDI